MNSEQFNLYGIQYLVSGDTKKARDLAGQARRLHFQLDLTDVPMMKLNYPDGSFVHVLRQAGHNFARIYVPVVESVAIEKKRKIEVNYLPAWEAYDGPDDSANVVGVIVCRGGGFNGRYELLLINNGKLPDDIPDESDFEEEKENRHWYVSNRIGNEKIDISYRDVIPSGIYGPHEVVTNSPNNAMELTWGYELFECPCYLGDEGGNLTIVDIMCINSYSRSNSFNHDIGISFGPSGLSDARWDAVYYEGSDTSLPKPVEFILNLNDGDLYSSESGSGNNQLADIASTVAGWGGTTFPEACPEAIAAAWGAVEIDHSWDPSQDPIDYYRTLHGDFRRWIYFVDPIYNYIRSSVMSSNYENTKDYHDINTDAGSIEDPASYSLIYCIDDERYVDSMAFSGVCSACDIGKQTDECTNPASADGAVWSDETTSVRDYSAEYKIALSNVKYDVDTLSDLVGMLGPDDGDGRWSKCATKYFKIGDLEIGLYWLQGLVDDDNFVSNYIEIRKQVDAPKEKATITITPLTGNYPFNTWYEFPNITFRDNPVYIRDESFSELKSSPYRRVYRGEFRLIEEIKTIEEL